MAEWLPTIGGGNFDLVTTNWGFESPRTVSGFPKLVSGTCLVCNVFWGGIMNLEVINKLFLELSQVATVNTAKELKLLNMLFNANDVLRSAMEISRRKGEQVDWPNFVSALEKTLQEQHRLLHPAVEKQEHPFG